MGKKKYKRGYDLKELIMQADSIEKYTDDFDTFLIRDGLKEKKYKKAIRIIRKAIENMRAGDGDKVFDPERYAEMKRRREHMGNSDND